MTSLPLPETDHGSDAARHNVPAVLSSFVGRGREVADLRATSADARLVTVVGAGGAGKTRIVREVAAGLAQDMRAANVDRILWVELAPVSRGADMAGTIAGLLEITASSGRPLVDAIVDALRTQRALIVLDNCEHIIEEAARFADAVLRGAPNLRVIATSREPLAIEGEIAWHMPGLSRWEPETGPSQLNAATASGYDAITLFVDRTRATTPGFALTDANATSIGLICARLDGLPLALELAAAVVPVLGIEGLVARLEDALSLLSRGKRSSLPRHRTLRAVLDWSYELLTDDERALLRHLSVFRCSFSLEDVESVCGPQTADARRDNVVPLLGRLVEHSLIEVREDASDARYRLLETVRQYGRALMQSQPEEREVRRRHAQWVADVAEAAEPHMFTPARGPTVARLRPSVDEIRAALTWATDPDGDALLAVRIAGALGWFWISGHPWGEGRELLRRTLAAADAPGIADADRPIADRIALGKVMYPMIGLSYFAGDTDTMLATSERELALWDSVDATPTLTAAWQLTAARGRALCYQLTALAHAMRGELKPALLAANRCIAVAERSRDRWLLAVMLQRRALVLNMIGEHAAAQVDYEASEAQLRALGEHWFLSLGLEGMAINALAQGNLPAAGSYARQGVLVLRDEPDAWFASRSLDAIAVILLAQLVAGARDTNGLAEAAARMMGAAESLRRASGAGIIGPDVARHAATASALRDRIGKDAWNAAYSAGLALSLDDVFRLMERDQVIAALAIAPTAAALPITTQVAGQLDVDVLGTLAIAEGGAAWSPERLPSGKGLELFLYLLLHRGATKEDIGLALWPDASGAQLRNVFHVTLHHLRRALGETRWIAFERNLYRLDRMPEPGRTLILDVDIVVDAGARARAWRRERATPTLEQLREARRALDRYRGALAQGVVRSDWIVADDDRIRTAWSDGAEALAHVAFHGGHHAEASSALEALLAREPLRESAHRLYLETLIARGEPARAMAHYDALKTLLQRELGARPAAETTAIAARARSSA